MDCPLTLTHTTMDITKLPLYSNLKEIIPLVEKYNVTILSTPTGSGKTLLLPSILAAVIEKKVFVTVPRVLLAKEARKGAIKFMLKDNKKLTGILTGKKKETYPETVITYCTEGSFMFAKTKPQDIIIVDEVHEQGINTELVLMRVREHCRKGGKAVIMSATMDMSKYQNYFADGCTVATFEMPIPSRPHETESYKVSEPIEEVKRLVATGHRVLIGCEGKKEIFDTIQKLGNTLSFPLHGELEEDEEEALLSCQKPCAIVSTSVAMSGITFDDLDAVVPPSYGRTIINGKMTDYLLSNAEIKQWEGRVGRIKKGIVVKAFSFSNYRDENPMPEILRSNLEETILKFFRFGYDVSNVETINRPPLDKIEEAKDMLFRNGFINESGITEKGIFCSEQPYSLEASNIIWNGKNLGLENSARKIAELISKGNPFRKASYGRIAQISGQGTPKIQSEHIVFSNAIGNIMDLEPSLPYETRKQFAALNGIFLKGYSNLSKSFNRIDADYKDQIPLTENNFDRLFGRYDLALFRNCYNSITGQYSVSNLEGDFMYVTLSPVVLKHGMLAEMTTIIKQ